MSALPIWIMPSDLVSEILPAKIGLFDLVILAEASQSDCQSIPVLLRGKKMIIIGDNKQLNPPAAPEDYKSTILDNLGTDLPFPDFLLPGKSVFDLFSIAFKGPCSPILLREHFRCYSCFHFMLNVKYFSALVVVI
jgi:superfamily I DNA and/or RNA helicase